MQERAHSPPTPYSLQWPLATQLSTPCLLCGFFRQQPGNIDDALAISSPKE